MPGKLAREEGVQTPYQKNFAEIEQPVRSVLNHSSQSRSSPFEARKNKLAAMI